MIVVLAFINDNEYDAPQIFGVFGSMRLVIRAIIEYEGTRDISYTDTECEGEKALYRFTPVVINRTCLS